jgi:hypothetical protein
MPKSALSLALWAGLLFVGMLVALEVGRRSGVARRAKHGGEAAAGSGAIDGAIFALLGLLVAFTFSAAASRFEHRRGLVVDEANAAGTAYLRLELLPEPGRTALRERFRQYVRTRLAFYERIPGDREGAQREAAKASAQQGEIWETAVRLAGELPTPAATMLLLPALNETFDLASARTAALYAHTPPLVFAMLFGLAIACALLAGVAMAGKDRNVLHVVAFALIIAGTVYVILDLEYPRIGLLRLDKHDSLLAEVLASM